MPDYGDILRFLARNPPQLAAERQMHASLLELLANCLRTDATGAEDIARSATSSFEGDAARASFN